LEETLVKKSSDPPRKRGVGTLHLNIKIIHAEASKVPNLPPRCIRVVDGRPIYK
jgi:hypothetical protein